jgi:hypothetical protein
MFNIPLPEGENQIEIRILCLPVLNKVLDQSEHSKTAARFYISFFAVLLFCRIGERYNKLSERKVKRANHGGAL